jgi:hypothetical protein
MTGKVVSLTTPDELRTTKKMSELAQSFPCLREAPGVDPFDAQELDRWAAGPVSHGERLTGQFLLSVWDSSTEWQCGRFDLMEALRIWDEEHHKAFLNWVANPWWP